MRDDRQLYGKDQQDKEKTEGKNSRATYCRGRMTLADVVRRRETEYASANNDDFINFIHVEKRFVNEAYRAMRIDGEMGQIWLWYSPFQFVGWFEPFEVFGCGVIIN